MEKQSRAAKLFELVKDFDCTEELKLKDMLTLSQLANLSYYLDNKLDKTNEFYAIDFNEQFDVAKEKTNIVKDFEHSELSFRLLLEEVLEYGFALEINSWTIYLIVLELYTKERKKYNNNNPKTLTNDEKLENIFDALTDVLVITYGRFHVLNAKGISNKLMKEVHKSNMSKFCDNLGILRDTIQNYKSLNEPVQSKKVGNKFLVFNSKTNKVLKSIKFVKPNIKKILKQFKII